VSDPSQAAREYAAAGAQMSARLAGHEPDLWLDALTDRYVAGDLTLDEFRAQVESLYPQTDQEVE